MARIKAKEKKKHYYRLLVPRILKLIKEGKMIDNNVKSNFYFRFSKYKTLLSFQQPSFVLIQSVMVSQSLFAQDELPFAFNLAKYISEGLSTKFLIIVLS